MSAKVIMVQGTMSNSGKALLLPDYVGYLPRMAIEWRPLSPRIWP